MIMLLSFWTMKVTTTRYYYLFLLNFVLIICFIFGLLLLMKAAVAVVPSSSSSSSSDQQQKNIHNNNNNNNDNINFNIIPFILIQQEEQHSSPSSSSSSKIRVSKILQNSLEQYSKEMYLALQSMSRLLEQTLSLEEEIFLRDGQNIPQHSVLMSTKIQHRINQMSICFEHNTIIMQQLLSELPYIISLPCSGNDNNNNYTFNRKKPSSSLSSLSFSTRTTTTTTTTTSNSSTLFHLLTVDNKNNKGNTNKKFSKNTLMDNNYDQQHNNAYDSPSQIVAHLVRDWTKLGINLRQNLYGWCRQQLHIHVNNTNSTTTINTTTTARRRFKKVLVPGAGMGRLSYDIWNDGYTVEANELSLIMAAATHGIIQRRIKSTIYPFVMDVMANEVVSKRRYDSIDFPDIYDNEYEYDNDNDVVDVDVSSSSSSSSKDYNNRNSFSFTIGNFVGEYYFSQSDAFDAIVTCFFIDTATNLYDYINLIATLLKRDGGVWINVGPVQWHGNAILRPSVDELYDLLVHGNFGFTIQHWSVDTEPIPYRQDEDIKDENFVRSTDFSSYRPLRFVAIRT